MHALALFLWLGPLAASATAQTNCTLLLDVVDGAVLLEEGMCDTQVTPASTFKLPLAVIAFEAGLLESATEPLLSYRPGEPDWGGANWTRDTHPRDWLRYSVVWYSQRLTRALGATHLTETLRDFGYGNADMSGEAGAGSGLERAWLGSSLKLSAREQAAFLHALVTGTLPVSEAAMTATRGLLPARLQDGWRITGKTGGAFEGGLGVGWFVGWATSRGRTLVFVHLSVAPRAQGRSPGLEARRTLLSSWPDLTARMAQ